MKFYVVGSKVTDEIKGLEQPGNGIIIKGFVSDEELEDIYQKCRIVVVPLRYGAGVKRQSSRSHLQRRAYCDHVHRRRGNSGCRKKTLKLQTEQKNLQIKP